MSVNWCVLAILFLLTQTASAAGVVSRCYDGVAFGTRVVGA